MEQQIKKNKLPYFADLAFGFVHKRSGNEIRVMYVHPDAVFRQSRDAKNLHKCIRAIHLCKILAFSNGCIFLTIGSIYTKLGDFIKLGLHFMTM